MSKSKMSKSWIALFLLLSLPIGWVEGSVQTESSPDILLGAALHQEEVEGEIEKAITTYQEVIAAVGVSRAQSARAQYRIGICYEKLGRREAQKAYEAVVSNYADQSQFVDLAKTRLAALGSGRPGSTTIRKLEVVAQNWDVFTPWNISADGRLAGSTAYETGNIAVLDLVTGEGRAVSNYGNWKNENGYVDEVAISRDGKWLAAWHYKHGATFGNIRIIGVDGKNERVLYRDPEGEKAVEWGMPQDWSPDGKWIAVQIERGTQGALSKGQAEIALISVEEGSKRVLKTYEYARRYRPKIKFSADGKYLAYDLPASVGATDTDLRLLSVTQGSEVRIAVHPASDELVDWTPKGELLFASERAGGRSLFRVKISNGQQDGDPVIVSRDFTSDWVLGLSRDGALFYAETDRRHGSYQTEIDLKTGKAIGDPKPLGGAVLEGVLSPVWSPDGKSTAFVRMRPSPGVSTLVIRDEKGEHRELFSSMEFLHRSALRWDKEGQPLLVWGRGREKTGIFRIDQRSGESSLLREGDYLGMGDWSSDGRYVYYRGAPDQCGITRRDTSSGEEETLYVAKSSVRPLRLSPKGDFLFFSEKENADDPGDRRMLILSIENGETQRLGKLDGDLYLGFSSSQVVWAPDGKRIYLAVRRRSGSKGRISEIAFTDIAGGDLGRTGLTSSGSITHLAIHPDGRELAWTVSTRVDTPWVMENFLGKD